MVWAERCGEDGAWGVGGGETGVREMGSGGGVSGRDVAWRVAHEAAEMLRMAQSASCCSSAEPEESIRTSGGSTPARTCNPHMEMEMEMAAGGE